MTTTSPGTHEQSLRPFLKWAGGKTRLLPKILPYVPGQIQSYHEPFLGGGAMYFAIRDRIADRAYLNDLNAKLVNVWQVVQTEPEALFEAMRHYKENDSKQFYYEQRQAEPATAIHQAAWFLYVNQTAWNGLWRVNRWGQFNVPWGDRPFRGIEQETLRALADVLADTTITCDDFRDALERPQPGDFVYLDPPYLPISETSKFYLYTKKRFRAPDLIELAEYCHRLTSRGIYWIMSNRDTQQVRDLFPENEIVRFTARRSVAAQNRRDVERRESPEALVLGVPLE